MLAPDLALHFPPGGGERQPDTAAVRGIVLPSDQSAVYQPVDHARQRRLAQQARARQLADARVHRTSKGCKARRIPGSDGSCQHLPAAIPPHQPGVRGKDSPPTPRWPAGSCVVITGRGVWPRSAGSVSWYGVAPVTLSPRLAFGRGWRAPRRRRLALTRLACVGGPGTSGSRLASISLRSTGTTSSPSRSSWFSTSSTAARSGRSGTADAGSRRSTRGTSGSCR